MEKEEKKTLKHSNQVAINKLRTYFTNEPKILFDLGYIGFHPNIQESIVNEIIHWTDLLDFFLHFNFKEAKIDYHFQSERGCYILSSIYCLANPSWTLIQGEFDFENKQHHYYHSWLEKEGIIFDPAMRIVTLKSFYEEFFVEKYRHHQKEVKTLFQRTGMFTYYEEDLKFGYINPIGKLIYYDTEKALQDASQILDSLDSFLKQKSK